MAEQLWTDERITQETQGAMMFSREIARRLMRQVRDDLQAALDAANQRIVELEAQAAWEPIGNHNFAPTLDADGLLVLAMRTSENGRIITLETMDVELEIDLQDKCLCRRKEAQP